MIETTLVKNAVTNTTFSNIAMFCVNIPERDINVSDFEIKKIEEVDVVYTLMCQLFRKYGFPPAFSPVIEELKNIIAVFIDKEPDAWVALAWKKIMLLYLFAWRICAAGKTLKLGSLLSSTKMKNSVLLFLCLKKDLRICFGQKQTFILDLRKNILAYRDVRQSSSSEQRK